VNGLKQDFADGGVLTRIQIRNLSYCNDDELRVSGAEGLLRVPTYLGVGMGNSVVASCQRSHALMRWR